MTPDSLPTEIILTHSHKKVGQIQLDWVPQPGNYIDVQGTTYAVLERHHHYQYKVGGYVLNKISVYVQSAQKPQEKTWLDGRWVIGDANCRLNARSELLRCAVNPTGPCQGCHYYEALDLE
ncbi:DUF6464 family protein [Spirulina sp. CS-785/01]|uniref:DUF6464 family protein n=1 Tax=Spirulina sp. CS-785/01 TaxID=3021716 RepID=UPI00232E8A6F|nr:DUF6464 family protein [Spirulina sp. CS-785/01]MDB9313217.1 DUF6464 family protein [Spirulina sp. CS-785/01]